MRVLLALVSIPLVLISAFAGVMIRDRYRTIADEDIVCGGDRYRVRLMVEGDDVKAVGDFQRAEGGRGTRSASVGPYRAGADARLDFDCERREACCTYDGRETVVVF